MGIICVKCVSRQDGALSGSVKLGVHNMLKLRLMSDGYLLSSHNGCAVE